jgi:hypothetical protein
LFHRWNLRRCHCGLCDVPQSSACEFHSNTFLSTAHVCFFDFFSPQCHTDLNAPEFHHVECWCTDFDEINVECP